jgi:hypothetical protein
MEIAKSQAVMKCTEQLVAHFKGADGEGNAVDPNSVIWTSSDETVATLVPKEGGLDCHVIGGVPGECNVVANATQEGGKKAVASVLSLIVTVGEVESGTITTDPPVAQGSAPSQGLPSRPPRPNAGLPNTPGLKPDAGLPGAGKPGGGLKPDTGLPSEPNKGEGIGRPDAGLPPTPAPKV